MDERTKINVNQLLIWSDNPRHGLQSADNDLSEKDIINILIDVVGEEKMFNLAKDIFSSHGLMGNVLPTVVEKGNKYFVYDGNRRISAIKFIIQPELIDNIALQKKIIALVDSANTSFLSQVDVFLTTETNALELMDKTHGGEMNGVGIIPWDSYQRDISLSKRGKSPLYPYAFKIANLLTIKKKKDFIIPYTDLDRIFRAKLLRETFAISELSVSYKDEIITAITELKLYKAYRNFNSYSREFNIVDAGTELDSDKPIRRFCEWYLERQKGKTKFKVLLDPITLFTDEKYSSSLLNIRITDNNGDKINFSFEEIYMEYTSPLGKIQKELDTRIVGKWEVRINYKGVDSTSFITVCSLVDADVIFNENLSVEYGCSLDLTKVVIRALNSHKRDMIKTLCTYAIDGAIIKNNIFVAENPIGKYTISFRFDNEGAQYSINKVISVIDPKLPLQGIVGQNKPFEFNGNIRISFSGNVAHLINEVNSLWNSKFEYSICCSVRSIIELSLDALRENKIMQFSNEKLESRLNEFRNFLISSGLDILCEKDASLFKYLTEINFINSLDIKGLVGLLHLGAHKSASRVDMSILLEKCQKQMSVLISYIEKLII